MTVEEYKYQQEKRRAEEAAALADAKEKEATALAEQARKKKAQVDNLNEQITVKEKAKATIKEVETMGHSIPLVPGVHFTDAEAAKLKTLAKKSVNADDRIRAAQDKQKDKIETLNENIRDLNSQITTLQNDVKVIARDRDTLKANYDRLWGEVKDFIHAIRRAPRRLFELITEHLPDIGKSKNQEVSR